MRGVRRMPVLRRPAVTGVHRRMSAVRCMSGVRSWPGVRYTLSARCMAATDARCTLRDSDTLY